MTLVQSLAAFLLAGGLLTITPGLDTALVLRTAAGEGRTAAVMAMVGIQLGCLIWGAAVAVGLGALLQASSSAYTALTWVGAAYLVYVGLTLLVRPRQSFAIGAEAPTPMSATTWLWRGLLTNLLNPKIGVFYVSFLPQFVPVGYAPAPYIFGLAIYHDLIGITWLSLLILGMDRLRPHLQRPAIVAWLDRLTGLVFVAFGLRLVLARRA
ncbi:LysE family translocator [Lichenihabitans sp. PAMC28606]|uniref:LysE family translocator n=1 Tax=Lichenihabitans sp. PAMC28606 TaxID=2880932 RepID=UPI001D0A71E7|nr:LysE family translocator [Lichenihabitans sp. PAMC28606]UDL96416.1 LysE family translocator [Lichenihabitans sp. PAMC28606]